jgi:hypothetical protein
MHIIISESQIKRIFDLDEADRDQLGKGIDHVVYKNRFTDKYFIKLGLESGGLVTKIGNKETIFHYAKEFKKFPDIFPIVIKYGLKKFNNEYFYDYENTFNAFMVIEKLDAKKFKNMYDSMHRALEMFLKLEGYTELAKSLETFNFTEKTGVHESKKKLIEELIDKNMGPQFLNFYQKLCELVDRLYELYDSGKLVGSSERLELDLHRDNFGISKSGKIKCLDF